MNYLEANRDSFDQIILNINIDGAGYREGPSAFSSYDLPAATQKAFRETVSSFSGIIEGDPWYQGDHSIFIQQGCPAIAVTSAWFAENIAGQTITQTPADNLEIVDTGKLVEIARALAVLIKAL